MPASNPNANARELFESLTQGTKREFEEKNYVLSFSDFLELFGTTPRALSRNAAEYMKDMIDHFGVEEVDAGDGFDIPKPRFKLFERQRTRNRPGIVGQEDAHDQIYRILEQFVRQGRVEKLILLHGPNGSSKSSTAEALAFALEEYSRSDIGAVYRFNWIFPNDKVGFEGLGETDINKRTVGFAGSSASKSSKGTFAHLSDDETLCKIVSELKENPIYLLPQKERVEFYLNSLKARGVEPDPSMVPAHIEEGALSAKNKKIFDALLVAYRGDLEKVMRHVQVERFFYSSRYRIGIATVEPQMSIDAQDRQLTMDRNVQNIPPVLQNIRMFEPSGDLIDANRGFIEFADLLKRPLEAFKYLLTTVEKMNINLGSGMADLDLVMIASTNEKHLDAFKASPDWPSFKGRFELVRVPYLLGSKQEMLIYQEDARTIEKSKSIAPHTVELLAKWAVLTRLRQPDPEFFEFSMRNLVARLDPFEKLALYDLEESGAGFSDAEKNQLRKLVPELKRESQISVAYEGRFGASPREMKMLLYFSAQSPERDQVSALSIFEEIEKLTRDRSVYDYLQFEPRGGYHDYREFLRHVRSTYAKAFHREFLQALNLFDEQQYAKALQRYLRHVVAYIKKERVENEHTGKLEDASETVMGELEDLMGVTGEKKDHRDRMVSRIAAWRVDTPTGGLEIDKVFRVELATIARRIYESKEEHIRKVRECMLMQGTTDYDKMPAETKAEGEEVFGNLKTMFGYSRKTAWESLVFLRTIAN